MSELQLPRQRCYVVDLLAFVSYYSGEIVNDELLRVSQSGDTYRLVFVSRDNAEAAWEPPVEPLQLVRACIDLPADATLANVAYDPDEPHTLRVYVRSAEFDPIQKGEYVPVHGPRDNGIRGEQWLRPKEVEAGRADRIERCEPAYGDLPTFWVCDGNVYRGQAGGLTAKVHRAIDGWAWELWYSDGSGHSRGTAPTALEAILAACNRGER
jgi:hypothetical protein